MGKENSREERLAAQLRANLKRRKQQARGLARRGGSPEKETPQDLPNPPGES